MPSPASVRKTLMLTQRGIASGHRLRHRLRQKSIDENVIHLLRKGRVLNQCKKELRVLLCPISFSECNEINAMKSCQHCTMGSRVQAGHDFSLRSRRPNACADESHAYITATRFELPGRFSRFRSTSPSRRMVIWSRCFLQLLWYDRGHLVRSLLRGLSCWGIASRFQSRRAQNGSS